MLTNYINKIEPFSKDLKEKYKIFSQTMKKLTNHHYKKSSQYKKILNNFNYNLNNENIEKFPFLPAKLFKEVELRSVQKSKISKVLLSSGTSGQERSKIYLDYNNSHNQIIVLSKIMSTILGNERLPMLILDNDPKETKSNSISARIAAINGFSIFGKDHTFLLDENDNINLKILNRFLKKYGNKKFFIFGFTSIVYKCFFEKLNNFYKKLDFSNAILLHGGGWKKMEEKKIDNNSFKYNLKKKFLIKKIYNYYGMVEQTGSIFLECENCSCFITTNYSEILIRDNNFKILKKGETGLIQVLSLLPTSYPGHSILTEDIGQIINDKKNCTCSRAGTRFKVLGRSKKSELRGCSDI